MMCPQASRPQANVKDKTSEEGASFSSNNACHVILLALFEKTTKTAILLYPSYMRCGHDRKNSPIESEG
jgi:hypothetical protein